MKVEKISDSDLYRQTYFIFHVMPSLTCNLDCKYCYVGDRRQDKTAMSIDQLKKVISKIESLKLPKKFYELSGGEIFLRSDWYEVFLLFLQTGEFISVNTNASTLNREDIKKISVLHKEFGDKIYFSISIDSHIEKIHNKTRGKFQETINTMKLFKEYSIPFRACVTINSYNYDTVIETVKYVVANFSNELSVGILRPVFSITEESKKLFVSLDRVQKIHSEVLKLKKDLGFEYYHCLDKNDKPFCTSGVDRISILPNGDIYSCYALINSEKSIGNILKDDLMAIFKSLITKSGKKDKSKLLCEHCEDKWNIPPVRLGK